MNPQAHYSTDQFNITDGTQLLIDNKYSRSPNYGSYYLNGKQHSFAQPWGANLRKPKIDIIHGMPDIILIETWGYQLIISHGGSIAPNDTVITFPIYATENNYKGAFNRMEAYIKHNYEYLPGLPSYIWGD